MSCSIDLKSTVLRGFLGNFSNFTTNDFFDLLNINTSKGCIKYKELSIIYVGKSRFLSKNAYALVKKISDLNLDIKKIFFITKSALCSKARIILEENGIIVL